MDKEMRQQIYIELEDNVTKAEDAMHMYDVMFDYSYDDLSINSLRQLKDADKQTLANALICYIVLNVTKCIKYDKKNESICLNILIDDIMNTDKDLTENETKIKNLVTSLNDEKEIIVWRNKFYAHEDKSILNSSSNKNSKLFNSKLNTYYIKNIIAIIKKTLELCKNYYNLY